MRPALPSELPGLDPEKDIEISVREGILSLRAERSQQTEHRHHCEFRYGSFAHNVRLPAGAREDRTTAEYKDGILTVSVPRTPAKKAAEKTIPVHRVTSS